MCIYIVKFLDNLSKTILYMYCYTRSAKTSTFDVALYPASISSRYCETEHERNLLTYHTRCAYVT